MIEIAAVAVHLFCVGASVITCETCYMRLFLLRTISGSAYTVGWSSTEDLKSACRTHTLSCHVTLRD